MSYIGGGGGGGGGGLCPPNLNIGGGAGAPPSPPPDSYAPASCGHCIFRHPAEAKYFESINSHFICFSTTSSYVTFVFEALYNYANWS